MEKICYVCDYCGQDIRKSELRAICIGYMTDSGRFDRTDEFHHYHDYCLEHLLTLHFEEEPEEEEIPDEIPTEEELDQIVEKAKEENDGGWMAKKEKDLGRLVALRNAGWTAKELAEEFHVSMATICKWLKEAKENENAC